MEYMNRNIFRLLTIIFIFISIPLHSEFIILNNGTTIECTIINNGENELTIRDTENKIRKIPQKDISMILKSKKLNLRKDKKSTGKATNTEYDNFSNGVQFGFKPGIIIPSGRFRKMSDIGYGASAELSFKDILFNTFDAGFSAGYYYSGGQDLKQANSQIYSRFILLPLFLYTSYNAELSENLSVVPGISIGAAYIDVEYEDYTINTAYGDLKKSRFIEPAVKAGLSLNYKLSRRTGITTSCYYGIIIEEERLINFAVISAGVVFFF